MGLAAKKIKQTNLSLVKNHIGSKYLIFCTDDSSMILMLLKKSLETEKNYSIKTFSDGESCIQEMDQQPDVLILDYNLSPDNSKMDGFDVLNKAREVAPNTKVIMLSGQPDIQVAVNCLKKGASDYIIKDNVMSLSVNQSVKKIIQGIELKKEIHELSSTIKRDKILIKGYFFLIFLLIVLISFLILR